MHSNFLLLITIVLIVDVVTFSFHPFRRLSISTSRAAKKVDWSDDSNIIRDNLPRITHDLVHRLVR